MPTLVMKFGGTSVGSADAIQHVLNIVRQQRQQWEAVVVVTSAMGGVTDGLVKLVRSATQNDQPAVEKHLDALCQRHRTILREFIAQATHSAILDGADEEVDALLDELRASLRMIAESGAADGQLSDAVMSMGERLMARVLSAIMRGQDIPAQGVDASRILVTNDHYQNAQPEFAASQANAQQIILPLLADKQVPVVTGYIGATPRGIITTLGRGGSDYSATYLANLIGADEVWIWTDVNGVMSADPRKIKEAMVMDSISYQEVSEFAHFGAKVLHPRAVEPLMTPHIPLWVKNTFSPEEPGTRINSQNPDGPRHLSAVTSIDGVLVFVPNNGHDSQATLQRTRAVLSEHFRQEARPVITVDSHAGRLLCYVVPTTANRGAMQDSVEALQATFSAEHTDWRVEPIAIVAAIGVVDIQQTVQVLNAVKSARAELLALGHGSPQCCLLAVPPQQGLRVMRRLHRMVLSIHANLTYAENDPHRPPTLNVPNNRKRRGGRSRNRRSTPPDRAIPL